MKSTEINIGATYRHRNSGVGYAKALKVLPPKTEENTTTRIVVKCAWSTDTNFNFGLIKYFSPRDMIAINVKGAP